MSQTRTYGSDLSSDDKQEQTQNVNVESEVDKLISNTKHNASFKSGVSYEALKKQYGDDETIVEKILDMYKAKAARIEKHAHKFIKKIQKKTEKGTFVDANQILQMALKVKEKKGLSDGAFKRFTYLYTKMLQDKYNSSSIDLTVNKFSKLFNTVPDPDVTREMNIPANDLKTAQKIMDLYNSTEKMWTMVNISTIKYKDLDPQFVQSNYNKDTHDPLSYANPIIVALFGIKNKVLDGRFLLSNFGNIFTRIYKKKQISGTNGAGINDVELFEDMTRTKDDTVCSSTSIVDDYYRRQQLQLSLIKCVLGIRSGRLFDSKYNEIDQLLVDCKSTNSELPEYAYIRDEGITLLKLFAAFVFRPTLVLEDIQRSITGDLPMRYIPFVDVKISNFYDPLGTNNQPINLQDKINTPELVRNNNTGMIEQRYNKSIHSSNGVLIFYVNRKHTSINYTSIRNGRAYSAGSLPVTLASIERVNPYPVNATLSITSANGDEFKLRSIVCVDVTTTDNDGNSIISGTKTLFVRHPEDPSDDYIFFLYDPVNVSKPYLDPVTNVYTNRHPIGYVNETGAPGTSDEQTSFRYMAQKYGTIYIYEKVARLVSV